MSVMPHIILRHVTGRAEGDDGATTKSNLSPPNKLGGWWVVTSWVEAHVLFISELILMQK